MNNVYELIFMLLPLFLVIIALLSLADPKISLVDPKILRKALDGGPRTVWRNRIFVIIFVDWFWN
jgi:hypothetical protein